MKKQLLSLCLILTFHTFAQHGPVEFSFYTGIEKSGDYSQRFGVNHVNKSDFHFGITSGLNISYTNILKRLIYQTGVEFSNRTIGNTSINGDLKYATVIRFPIQIGKVTDFEMKNRNTCRISLKFGFDYNIYYTENQNLSLTDFVGANSEICISKINTSSKVNPSIGVKIGAGLLMWEEGKLMLTQNEDQFIYSSLFLRIGIFNKPENKKMYD